MLIILVLYVNVMTHVTCHVSFEREKRMPTCIDNQGRIANQKWECGKLDQKRGGGHI